MSRHLKTPSFGCWETTSGETLLNLWKNADGGNFSFQRCCLLVGHARHKASYHVPWQASMFFFILCLLFFTLVSFYLDEDRDGIYETDRKLCTRNYVKDGDFKWVKPSFFLQKSSQQINLLGHTQGWPAVSYSLWPFLHFHRGQWNSHTFKVCTIKSIKVVVLVTQKTF